MPPRFGVSAAPTGIAAIAIAATAPRPVAKSFVLVLIVCPPSMNLVTGHPMAWAHFSCFGPRLPAALHRDGTARMEHASGGRIDRARHLAHRRAEGPARLDGRVRH